MVHLACDNGGPPLALSDDAAMLSIHLEEVVGSAGRPMPVMSVDGTLLSRARVAALVALLEGFAELVQHFPADQKVKLRTNGIDHCETCGMVDRGVALLDKFSVNDSALIAQLLGDLRYLDCPLPTTVLAARFAALLRGYDVPTLWSMLNAPNDLSDEEQAKALSEPLFRPVPAEEVPSWEAPGPPSLARSVSISMDGGIPDELSIRTCLTWCDAKTLRSLKAVSSAWRRRARRELGDGHSDWRRAPLWSPSAAAAAHVAALGGLKHQIVAALRELQLVDAAVDLPAHVAAILPLLADEDEDVSRAAMKMLRRSGWGGVLQMSWHARGLTMALAGYLLVGPFPAMGLGLGAHFGLSLLPTLSARKRRHDDESQQQSSHKRARVHAAGKWGSG